MRRIDQIVAATDLSDASLPAVDRAFLVAAGTGARLTLLHALGLDALGSLQALVGGDETAALARELTDRQREALAALAAEPARHHGVTAGVRVEAGSAMSAITDYADGADADLIVVGAHGSGFVHRFVFGSTASRLVRRSRRPVLVVRTPCRGPYRRVLVAVDFSPASARALRLAREVAPGAHMVLVNIVELPVESLLSYSGVRSAMIDLYRSQARQSARERLAELAATAGLAPEDFTPLAEEGEPATRLLALQETHGADLMVMGKHGTHVTEELLLGSRTGRVLAQAAVDVLVVTDRRKPVRTGE